MKEKEYSELYIKALAEGLATEDPVGTYIGNMTSIFGIIFEFSILLLIAGIFRDKTLAITLGCLCLLLSTIPFFLWIKKGAEYTHCNIFLMLLTSLAMSPITAPFAILSKLGLGPK